MEKRAVSIYIHIPFCEKKCPYCDFVSFDNKSEREIALYAENLCQEIKEFNAESADGVCASTVFFGGGTPSFIAPYHIKRILDTIRGTFNVLPSAEITIECNPNSLTDKKLAEYKSFGINRISIGVQSFDNDTLKKLGRTHTAEQAAAAVHAARKAGFTNINIDLMHSIPNSALTIRHPELLNLVTHVSAYALTPDQVPEAQSIREQKLVEKMLRANGFKKYEVSNFARPGYECEHNKVYWDPTREYLGFGTGAHSLFNNKRFSDTESYERTENDIFVETVMLGLRTTRGVSLDILNGKQKQIEELLKLKLVKITKNRLVATQKGFFVLNAIIRKLTG